jgi:hypothetical protein
LVDEAVKLAEKIANNSPLINIMAKESVNRAFETTLQEGLLYERRMFHTTFSTVSPVYCLVGLIFSLERSQGRHDRILGEACRQVDLDLSA